MNKNFFSLFIIALLAVMMSEAASAQVIDYKMLNLTEAEENAYISAFQKGFNPENIRPADSLYNAAKAEGHTNAMIAALHLKSLALFAAGESSVYSVVDQAAEMATSINLDNIYYELKSFKSTLYGMNGDIQSMMDETQKLTHEASIAKNDEGLYLSYTNMANVFVMRDNPRLAKMYYTRSLEYGKKLQKPDIYRLYIQLANCYDAMKKKDSAKICVDSCIALSANAPEMAKKQIEFFSLDIGDSRSPEQFIKDYNRIIPNNPIIGALDPNQVAWVNARYCAYRGNYDSAYYWCQQMDMGVNSLNATEEIALIQKDWKKAYDFRFQADMIHDSLQAVIQSQDFAAQDAKINNAELRIETERLNERNKRIMIISIFSVILVIVTFIVIITIAKQRNLIKQKAWLESEVKRQTGEIVNQAEEIKTQNEEILAQNEEILSQRDTLAAANKNITASIQYAKRMQTAAVPTLEFMRNMFSDCTIMWRPLNIVSGDFYWATEVGGKKLLAVADCTGHGVPGAFMSMLGISMLNEIAKSFNPLTTTAADIVNTLRDNIITSLKETNETGATHDGMDISFCIIDEENHKLQYAGAHRPLIQIRDNNATEFKGDRMPVGIYYVMESFKNIEIDTKPGDWYYMFSDGIQDQFGFDNGATRKFSQKRLVNILNENHLKTSDYQSEALAAAIDKWRYSETYTNPQLDDQLVVGIRM